jgi:thiol-disulfide isomerase/thioredoxin
MTSIKDPRNNKEHFWTPLRTVLTVVVLSLIAIGGVSSCTSSDEKSNRVATQSSATPKTNGPANAPAPVDTSPLPLITSLPPNVLEAKLKTVNGSTITLGDYSGKVLLVNLWATWCGPCRGEIPELVKLHKEFHAQGLEMVGLTTEDPDRSAAQVKSFVHDFQMDYHVGWATPDVALTFMRANQSGSIPQNFIISRDGRILKKFIGFNPVYTAPEIRQAITDALKG